MEATCFTKSNFYELEAVSAGTDSWNGIHRWLFRVGIGPWGSRGPTLAGIGLGVPVDRPSWGSGWGSYERTLAVIDLGFLWTDPHGDQAVGFPWTDPVGIGLWGSRGRTLAGIDLGFLWTDPRGDQAVGCPWTDPHGDRSRVPVN